MICNFYPERLVWRMYKISFMQISYFLKLAQTLNYTEAAKILYISQPALSKQIAALEKELGFALFRRTNRSVELTLEGESLYQDWSSMDTLLNSSISTAKMIRKNAVGRLTLGLTDTFAISESFFHVVDDFRIKYPNINLDLESYGFRTIREMFNQEELNIILIPEFELENYTHVHTEWFQSVKLCIAISKKHPLAKKEHLAISDIKSLPMIVISPNESLNGINRIKNICRKEGFEPNIVKYTSNLNSLVLGVANGVGVTLCDNGVRSEKIRTYPLEEQPNDSDLYLVWKESAEHAEVKFFLDEIKSVIDDREKVLK